MCSGIELQLTGATDNTSTNFSLFTKQATICRCNIFRMKTNRNFKCCNQVVCFADESILFLFLCKRKYSNQRVVVCSQPIQIFISGEPSKASNWKTSNVCTVVLLDYLSTTLEE